MEIIIRVAISIGSFVLGVIALTHNFQLTRLFGHNYYAEKYLGTGGTYNMWKLIGVIFMAGGVIYLFK
jgi:hypothetical protein